MNFRLFLLSFLCVVTEVSGQNLVPNGSFEEFSSCPQFLDNITDCVNWVNSRNSCDYFHSCGINGVSTPSNVFGFQVPYHGMAYSGIAAYNSSSDNYREHLGIELIEPLQMGQKYFLSYWVSKSQISGHSYSCNGLGALLSNASFSQEGENSPLTESAQVLNNNIISDTISWSLIDGSFIADSAFSHLYIGCFLDDAELDVQLSADNSGVAYYYIDDVRLSSDSLWVYSGIGNAQYLAPCLSEQSLSLEDFSFNYPQELKRVQIFDLNGTLTIDVRMDDLKRLEEDVSRLPCGIYIVRAYCTNGGMRVEKVYCNYEK